MARKRYKLFLAHSPRGPSSLFPNGGTSTVQSVTRSSNYVKCPVCGVVVLKVTHRLDGGNIRVDAAHNVFRDKSDIPATPRGALNGLSADDRTFFRTGERSRRCRGAGGTRGRDGLAEWANTGSYHGSPRPCRVPFGEAFVPVPDAVRTRYPSNARTF